MSRYTGPTFRKSRRYGFSILENNKEFDKGKKRTSKPGDHGDSRKKISNYGQHLYEKQKVKFMYGLNERQFQNLFKLATRQKGNTGLNLLSLLESRLDNLVFRIGYSMSRRGARQLVNHGHILVDNKKATIPSMIIKPGQEISLKQNQIGNPLIQHAFKQNIYKKPYISINDKVMNGKYERLPLRKEISEEIKEALIIEYYNK